MIISKGEGRTRNASRQSVWVAMFGCSLACLAGLSIAATGQNGVAMVTFNYQGQLAFAGQPVTNTCDFEFGLYESSSSPTLIGQLQMLDDVSVTDGLFSVDLTFPQTAFDGSERWLSTSVDCDGSAVLLQPRQQVTPAPMAAHSNTASALLGGETDPSFQQSAAATIAAVDVANWNSAHAWGDHAAAGYLTSEVDGDASNEIQQLSANGNQVSISGGNSVVVADAGWSVVNDDQYSSVPGNVGIGTTTPDNKLDVAGKISLTQSTGDEMVIINDDVWVHGSGPQDFGTGGAHFVMASRETDYESVGIHGDGNAVTIWSPGDANNGQPSALVYFLDEDRFDGAVDANPHNNNALYAYINTAGNFVSVSDARRKTNIQAFNGVLDRLLRVNAYQYAHRLTESEVDKGQIAPVTYGLLAQELELLFPEVVERSDDGALFVSYSELIPVLIEGVKEQQNTIERLNAQNAALSDRLDAIEARLNGSSGN